MIITSDVTLRGFGPRSIYITIVIMQMFSVIIVYLHKAKVNNFKPYSSLFKLYKIQSMI